MNREPDARYATAEELHGDIESWLADMPFSTHAESVIEKLARWNRRNGKWVAVTMAMAVTTLVVAAIAIVMISVQKRRADENTTTCLADRQ